MFSDLKSGTGFLKCIYMSCEHIYANTCMRIPQVAIDVASSLIPPAAHPSGSAGDWRLDTGVDAVEVSADTGFSRVSLLV